MRNELIGAVVLEITKIAGQWFRSRPITSPTTFSLAAEPAPHKVYYLEEPEVEEAPEAKPIALRQLPVEQPVEREQSEVTAERATSIPTGCVPCAIGHLGTGSGLLNEAMRFAGKDGMTSVEVIDRVGMCLDELNAMERVDLRPEMVVNLPDWERKLVDQVLVASRETRHRLEAMESVESLEKCAATLQETRAGIWRDYVKNKAANLTPDEISEVQRRLLAKFQELTSEEGSDES